MTSLKLHFDGWLSLPANIRRQLGLSTGDELFAEIVEGGVMLRVDDRASAATESVAPMVSTPVIAEAAAAPSPPKKTSQSRPEAATVTAPAVKVRGRQKAAAPSETTSTGR